MLDHQDIDQIQQRRRHLEEIAEMGHDAYPISGAVWAVAYVKQPKGRGERLARFLRWMVNEGQEFAEGEQYARLPTGLVKRAEEKINRIIVE